MSEHPSRADFAGKYVTGIYPTVRKPTLLDLRPISILLRRALDNLAIATAARSEEKGHESSDYSNRSGLNNIVKLRVAEKILVIPRSTQNVLVVNTGQGLIYFKPDGQLAGRDQQLFAKRLLNFLINRSIYILMVSATSSELQLHETYG